MRKIRPGRWAIKLRGRTHNLRIGRHRPFEIAHSGPYEEAQCVDNHLDWRWDLPPLLPQEEE